MLICITVIDGSEATFWFITVVRSGWYLSLKNNVLRFLIIYKAISSSFWASPVSAVINISKTHSMMHCNFSYSMYLKLVKLWEVHMHVTNAYKQQQIHEIKNTNNMNNWNT